MEEKQKIVKKAPKKINKISFFYLFKNFRWKMITYWLTLILIEAILYLFLDFSFKLFFGEIDTKNFANFFPDFIRVIFDISVLSKKAFLTFFAILIVLHFFLSYFLNLQKRKLQIEGEYYVKNLLLDKFRQLPFEER
jgi:hypothetical protein